MTDKTLKLIKELSELYGPSSYEDRVRDYVKKELQKHSDEIVFDRLGSVIAVKKSKKPNAPSILMLAHLDEVGFMVTGVEDDGFLEFTPLGGFWAQVLMGTCVAVHGKQDWPGVITSRINRQTAPKEQLAKEVSISQMRIDCGFASKQDAHEFGVFPGTYISPSSNFHELAGGKRVMGKAFDDRAGIAAIIEMMEAIKDLDLDCNIYAGGSCEEEGGNKSAKAAVHMINPDIFIAVDCSNARDLHGKNETARLGNGFLLRFLDGKMRPNLRLKNYIQTLADKNNVKYQLFNSYGGTDAAVVQNENNGIITGVIGIPVRHTHSHLGVMEKADYESAKDMLITLAKDLDEEAFKKLISY